MLIEPRLSLTEAAKQYNIDRRTLRRKLEIAGLILPGTKAKLYLKPSEIDRALGDCSPKYQYRRLRQAS